LRTRFLAAASVLLLAFVAGGCGGSGSSKHANALVFVSTREGPYELYTASATGGDQHRLTNDKGDASKPSELLYQIDPAWSPDGTRIAFASSRSGQLEVYTVDASGKDTTQLTRSKLEDRYPSWSPDGRRIAFAHGAPSRVYVMGADGRGVKPLTVGTDEQIDPAWAPRGNWIAYSRRTPGESVREIWIVHPDGSGARPVTKLEASSTQPAWSPDGTRIAFASNVHGGHIAIYTIRLDGSGLQEVSASSPTDQIDPAWSPDGKTIVFSSDGALVSVAPSGGTETVLTDGKDNDVSPAWNPAPAKGS